MWLAGGRVVGARLYKWHKMQHYKPRMAAHLARPEKEGVSPTCPVPLDREETAHTRCHPGRQVDPEECHLRALWDLVVSP